MLRSRSYPTICSREMGVGILHRHQLAACADGEHMMPCVDAVAVLGDLCHTLGVERIQIGLMGLPCRQGNAGLHLCLDHGRGQHGNAVQQFQFRVQAGLQVRGDGFAGTGTLHIDVFMLQNDLFQIAGEVICPFIQGRDHGAVKANLCRGVLLIGVTELHQRPDHRILLQTAENDKGIQPVSDFFSGSHMGSSLSTIFISILLTSAVQ